MADYTGTLGDPAKYVNGDYTISGTYGGKVAAVNADGVWLYTGSGPHSDPAWLAHTTKGTDYTTAFYFIYSNASTPPIADWSRSNASPDYMILRIAAYVASGGKAFIPLIPGGFANGILRVSGGKIRRIW